MFGYFRRVKNSLVGMLIGFLMIPGSVLLHAWNEYRTVHRTRGIAEAKELIETLPSAETVSAEHDKKLVHITGQADTDETLVDEEFFVGENAIHLRRNVMMFQWTEDKKRNSENNNEYEYKLAWVDHPVDSSQFHQSTGHENPDMPYLKRSSTASDVRIGVYQLDDKLTNRIKSWQQVELPEAAITENVSEDERERYLFRNNELFIGVAGVPQPERPEIGDLRIGFEAVPPTEVSLAAQLRGDRFGPFETSNGEIIQTLYTGNLSAEDVMRNLQSENNVMAWVLRFIGFAICVGGFALCLKPLSAIVSFIPFAEQLTGALTFFVAVLLALLVSLTTIGISWVAVRPILGIGLLAAAAGAFFLVRRMSKKQETVMQAEVVS